MLQFFEHLCETGDWLGLGLGLGKGMIAEMSQLTHLFSGVSMFLMRYLWKHLSKTCHVGGGCRQGVCLLACEFW